MSELWEQFETYIKGITDGSKTPGSGRLGIKGDIQTKTLLIECKQRSFISPNRWAGADIDWLNTVVHHAKAAKKIPILAYQRTFPQDPSEIYIYCRIEDFETIVGHDDTLNRLGYSPQGWACIWSNELRSYCQKNEKEDKPKTAFRGNNFANRKQSLPGGGFKRSPRLDRGRPGRESHKGS